MSALSGLLLLLLGSACLYCAWSTSSLLRGNRQVDNTSLLTPWAETWLLTGDRARIVDMDIPQATAAYWQAVRRNPLHMSAWFALARLEMAGSEPERIQALQSFLLSTVPFSTPRGWDFFLLAAESHNQAALQQALDRVLEKLPSHREEAFVVARQVWDWDEIYQRVAPSLRWHVVQACQRYGDVPASMRLFERLHDENPMAMPAQLRTGLIDFLLARREWSRAGSMGRPDIQSAPVVENGDFEAALSEKGFGWRYPRAAGYDVRRRMREDGQGHALLFRFAGTTNIAGGLAWQFVPVRPDTSYVLHYRSRSIGISTNERPFLEIRGMDDRAVHAVGSAVEKSGAWTEQSLSFTTSGNCTLIWLGVRRTPSRKLDNKISGQLWLDDVVLSGRPETVSEGQ